MGGLLGLLVVILGIGGVVLVALPPPEAASALTRVAAGSAITPSPAPLGRPAPANPPSPAPALPHGKGMWIHYLRQAAGGDPVVLVAQAKSVGLSHVYLRLGSSKDGFYGQPDLDRLLPVAHAAGLSVVGWDFPYLFDAEADAQRAAAMVSYTTPTGQRIDAFSADIETAAEGVNISVPVAETYSARLRQLVGPGYPLVATVPRPRFNRGYPYAEILHYFDAAAPMIYWLDRDPAEEVQRTVDDLVGLGRPIMPVGQAYDAGPEGGPPGSPPKEHLVRFIQAATARGVTGFSFWVWHTATPDQWAAIREAQR